jgi:hypothetical protein
MPLHRQPFLGSIGFYLLTGLTDPKLGIVCYCARNKEVGTYIDSSSDRSHELEDLLDLFDSQRLPRLKSRFTALRDQSRFTIRS